MQIIAHRGGRPENTIEAFKNCVYSDFTGIEFDVWKTVDGIFIVVHDANLNDKRIETLTIDQVKTINPKIPTLKEMLDTISHQCIERSLSLPLLNLEIKPFGIAKELAIWLKEYIYYESLTYSPDNFVITSFLHTEILKFIREFPEINVGWIMSCYPVDLDKTLAAHPYINVLVFCRNAINKEHIESLKNTLKHYRRDMKIWAYCSKTSLKSAIGDLEFLLDTKIDAYITDYPNECYKMLRTR